MIILIDTEDKVIEVEGDISAKDTKKNLRLALKEFEDYNYVAFDPIKITFIPIDLNSTIDNLLKGASGQAVQNMNLMFGLDEMAGLKLKGMPNSSFFVKLGCLVIFKT
jgi:hypothetical protein